VIQDRLRVEAPRAGAYSVFFIGEAQDTTYQASYTWYRSAGADGKGAPRFVDHLDIDGDGASEVLVEVFGENSRWFASLARRGGAWTKVFEDACGQGSSTRSP
jgi:hypothetical protein